MLKRAVVGAVPDVGGEGEGEVDGGAVDYAVAEDNYSWSESVEMCWRKMQDGDSRFSHRSTAFMPFW